MAITVLLGSLTVFIVFSFWLSRRRLSLAARQTSLNMAISTDRLIDALVDGVIIIDRQARVRLFNASASRISGRSAKEALGADWRQIFPLVTDKGVAYGEADNPFAKVLKSGRSLQHKVIFLLNRESKPMAISLIVSPLGAERPPQGVVGVFRDITQEVTEEQAGNEFISTASHEMRTPLAAIEGYLSLAQNDKTSQMNQMARTYLDKAHAATEHLSVLFQDLLTSTRAEDGRLASNPEAVEVGATLLQIVDGARFSAEEKGLELSFILSHSQDTASSAKVIRPLYYVYADLYRIREVFQNIIDNAIKYTLSGKIKVSLTGDDRVVQIQVTDTGPGISAEDIPHLFQKFYRIDNSLTRSVGGTGLGLFICRKIIELYNGRIWVESSLGKGSTFFINLPRLPAEQAF